MKNLIHYITILLLFVSTLFSCRPDRQSISNLEHAESLLDQRPDSALIFLNKITPNHYQ